MIKKTWFRWLAITIIAIGLFAIIYNTWQAKKRFVDQVIVNDVANLYDIFKKIHETTKIIGFEHTKNYIDFLNVGSFLGSEIGSMNLTYPRGWEGPYLQKNLTVQEKFYQVIKNNQGYFIVPGDGVKLGNGYIVGKDIIIDQNADIKAMVNNHLLSSYGPLARELDFLGYQPRFVQSMTMQEDLDE